MEETIHTSVKTKNGRSDIQEAEECDSPMDQESYGSTSKDEEMKSASTSSHLDSPMELSSRSAEKIENPEQTPSNVEALECEKSSLKPGSGNIPSGEDVKQNVIVSSSPQKADRADTPALSTAKVTESSPLREDGENLSEETSKLKACLVTNIPPGTIAIIDPIKEESSVSSDDEEQLKQVKRRRSGASAEEEMGNKEIPLNRSYGAKSSEGLEIEHSMSLKSSKKKVKRLRTNESEDSTKVKASESLGDQETDIDEELPFDQPPEIDTSKHDEEDVEPSDRVEGTFSQPGSSRGAEADREMDTAKNVRREELLDSDEDTDQENRVSTYIKMTGMTRIFLDKEADQAVDVFNHWLKTYESRMACILRNMSLDTENLAESCRLITTNAEATFEELFLTPEIKQNFQFDASVVEIANRKMNEIRKGVMHCLNGLKVLEKTMILYLNMEDTVPIEPDIWDALVKKLNECRFTFRNRRRRKSSAKTE